MAENEERIWIEYDIPKPKGAIKSTRSITITRQEAITRLAKCFCQYSSNYRAVGFGCESCKRAKDKEKCEELVLLGYSRDAEAALDALLSLHG